MPKMPKIRTPKTRLLAKTVRTRRRERSARSPTRPEGYPEHARSSLAGSFGRSSDARLAAELNDGVGTAGVEVAPMDAWRCSRWTRRLLRSRETTTTASGGRRSRGRRERGTVERQQRHRVFRQRQRAGARAGARTGDGTRSGTRREFRTRRGSVVFGRGRESAVSRGWRRPFRAGASLRAFSRGSSRRGEAGDAHPGRGTSPAGRASEFRSIHPGPRDGIVGVDGIEATPPTRTKSQTASSKAAATTGERRQEPKESFRTADASRIVWTTSPHIG